MLADGGARRARCAPSWIAGLVSVAIAAVPVAAQPAAVAVPQESRVPPPAIHPHAGLGGYLAFGRAHQAGRPDTWLVRLDYDVLPVLARPGEIGGVFGFGPGLQVWRGGGDWGFGIPFAIVTGVRAPGVRATVGFGFEAFLVDRVAGDTGVGLFAPLASAGVGLDLRGWRAGVDGRVTRRWQIGADDHTQWQASVFVGRVWESTLDGPVR